MPSLYYHFRKQIYYKKYWKGIIAMIYDLINSLKNCTLKKSLILDEAKSWLKFIRKKYYNFNFFFFKK